MTDTTSAVNRILETTHVNGTSQPEPTPATAPKKRKPAKRSTSTRKTSSSSRSKRLESFRTGITIALGVAIPALSLALWRGACV